MEPLIAVYPSRRDSVARARGAVVAYARSVGFQDDSLYAIECAVGEALANAAEHGHRPKSSFTVRAEVLQDALRIEVKDSGCGFVGWNHSELPQRESLSPRGFGIGLMRATMDGVEYTDGGTCVRLMKHLPTAWAAERREA